MKKIVEFDGMKRNELEAAVEIFTYSLNRAEMPMYREL